MPLLGFTKLKEKLLDSSKTQTIRKPRKHPIKVGDKLYVYWKLRTKECEKLGEAIVIKVVRKKAIEFTREDAIKDGFEADQFRPALNNLVLALEAIHPNYYTDDKEFDIITFEWTLKLWEQ